MAHRVDRVTQKVELARPGAIEHPEDRQQRRLARARRSHDRHELAGLNLPTDASQNERPAGRRLEHAMRWVAETRRQCRALEHNGTRVAVGKPLDARVFLAESDATGQQHDGRVELQAAEIEAQRVVERLGDEAQFLSHGLKQALELAMVLALEPKVLLLDEPTAGLTRAERQGFAEILIGLVTRERLCVLIIEHDLDFVRLISSRIIVLHQGRIALDGSVADVVDAPLVREIYTGRSASDGCGVTP